MIPNLRKVVALIAVTLIPGCNRSHKLPAVPAEQTSETLDTGEDPGKPAKEISLVWMHHSTGDNILKGGLKAALDSNNVKFHDINYKEAEVGGYVVGDHTDPQDFPKAFNTPEYFNAIKSWELDKEKKHDVVMFKSCFPSAQIKDDEMMENYKKYYTSMIKVFEENPDILFVGMSSPPLVRGETTPENAKRAREWSTWLTQEYSKKAKNVRIFDIYNALAIREGYPHENTLVPQYAEDKWDSHPTDAAAKAVTRMFIPWLNRTLQETGFDKKQAVAN